MKKISNLNIPKVIIKKKEAEKNKWINKTKWTSTTTKAIDKAVF